jgi:hypothetical protein
MGKGDELIIQSVKYKSDEIIIAADILRRPFLSPYIGPSDADDYNTRHEPGELK